MSWLSKNITKISYLQLVLPKTIAFIFSLATVTLFFIEGYHVSDNLQPFLAVFIFLFWDIFWLLIILKGFGFTEKNQ